MAAAVAKAPEKNKVPENPQVPCASSFHNGRGKQPPRNLPWGGGLKPFPCLGHSSWGQMSQSMETTTNRKPKYRTGGEFPRPFETNTRGEKNHHRAPTYGTLENTEDKIWIKKVMLFQLPRWWSLRAGRAVTARESWMERLSHLWLFSATHTADVSKPRCMFWILKDYCSHLQKT